MGKKNGVILLQPFPGYLPSAKIIRFAFLSGLVVFLILVLFKPFNIDTPGNHFSFWHALLYGTGAFIAVVINSYGLPLVFRRFFREEAWNVGRELVMMLWQVVSISFINLTITHVLYKLDFSFGNTIQFLGITAAVGIFPVTLIILLKQQILFRRHTDSAAVLEQHLQNKYAVTEPVTIEPVQVPAIVTLTGDNQHELLTLPLNSIRFINAADNYIKVNYLEASKPAQKVLRSTLKKAEASLDDYPQLFRCHRAYIVNLAAVSHISGNAQGFRLHLHDSDDLVPVSRNLNDEITMLLNQYSTVSR